MIRKLLNGALGALATIAVIYAFGAFGLLYERLFGASEASTAVAIIGLIVAILIGVAVLHHLSRRTDSRKPQSITTLRAPPHVPALTQR